MEDIPDPTLAVRLLSITRNQDLSDWVFCSSDQKSLCRNLVESGITTREFSTRHCQAHSTMKRYMRKYRIWKSTGIDNFHDSKGGRPAFVDHDGIINIRNTLRTAMATQQCQTTMISNI
jgi:transposase